MPTPPDAPYKQNQRLRQAGRQIAVSARLAEYQQLFGRSAITELNELVESGREDRVEAWKGVMSSYATLKSRMPQPTLVE